MKKSLIAILLASSGLMLSACNDSDDGGSGSTSSADINNIQNPVVTTTAYSKDADIAALAADSELMTYKMKGVNGDEVQATALVFTPPTAAPTGGWPVVVWAHGTTGVADQCAPSQQGLQGTQYLLMKLLAAGYVVVAPDYEGLGEPGGKEAHPFLNVKSEAYSITDAVVAARDYLTKQGKLVSKQWMTVGHSQGGQAALGAAQYATRANLDYKGTVAVAPASNLTIILNLGESQVANADLNTKITTLASLDTFTSLITAGLQTSNPSLKFSDIFKSPTDKIAETANTVCYTQLGQSLGAAMGVYASQNAGSLDGYPRTQSNFMALPAVSKFLVTDSQPLQVKLNQPVIIYQGGADTTVPKSATDLLLSGVPAKESQISYRTNDAWDHTTAYVLNLDNIVADVQSLMPTK